MKRKTWRKLILILLIVSAFVFSGFLYFLQTEKRIPPELNGPYAVLYVIDGDTIIADVENTSTKIRLIGIDTPESAAEEDYKENTKEGEEAAAFLSDMLEGKQVYLEYDTDRYDKYGRTLAYVYLQDGETMVEEILLKEGLAKTMKYYPNTKYADSFEKLQNDAKKNSSGFWGTGFYK